jgi:hypothetical protein
MPSTFTSQPVDLDVAQNEFSRADIEFHGVDHSGASYEARIYLNRPDADANTDTSLGEGYAGSFYIFGHGGCYGDDHGHCEVVPRRAYDPRPEHPLARATKVVIATDAIRRALDSGNQVTVSVVPVVTSLTEKCDPENVLDIEKIELVLYN